jgi:hypothetical protein
VPPTKLRRSSGTPLMGPEPIYSLDARFVLSAEQVRRLRSNPTEVQLQASSTHLGDEYPARVHWPCQQDFRINRTAYRCASPSSFSSSPCARARFAPLGGRAVCDALLCLVSLTRLSPVWRVRCASAASTRMPHEPACMDALSSGSCRAGVSLEGSLHVVLSFSPPARVWCRCAARPPQQKLAKNMRDAPANLSAPSSPPLFKEGWNHLTVWTYDSRPFALFVTLVHRRSMDDVRALIPADPRPKEVALQVKPLLAPHMAPHSRALVGCDKWIGKQRQLRAPSPDQTVSRTGSLNVELIGCQSVRQWSRASFRCGRLSVRREAANRVTINC